MARVREKESLGEYGSGWGWDDKYPYVFSYEQGDGSPTKYNNTVSTTKPTINNTWVDYGNPTSKAEDKQCVVEITDGQMLVSGSNMLHSVSCKTHAYNAGNVYNFPATSVGMSDPTTRSICSKGWMLPQNGGNTSYSRLLEVYGIDHTATTKSNHDSGLVNLPLSFLRSGDYYYTGALFTQGAYGYYRMSSLVLYLGSDQLNLTYGTYANDGFSVRCVSR